MLTTQKRPTGLILTPSIQEGNVYLNLGKELATVLMGENLSSPSFGIKAYDSLKQILNDNIHTDVYGRSYIALTNINILFEPVLGINLRSLVEDYSKRLLLIIHIAHSVVENGVYYPFPDDKSYNVDLTDIYYSILE